MSEVLGTRQDFRIVAYSSLGALPFTDFSTVFPYKNDFLKKTIISSPYFFVIFSSHNKPLFVTNVRE
jgi:hypothetical protein